MHVIELFEPLLLAPNVHVVFTPLPDTVTSVVVHRGGQFKPIQHPLAPREGRVPAQIAKNKVGRTFCQLLHDLGRVSEITGPDQQMAVLRHQNMADDPEAQLRPEIIERSGELKPEPLGVEDAGAAIDVRGEVGQMILTIIMLRARHGGQFSRDGTEAQTSKLMLSLLLRSASCKLETPGSH